MARAGHKYPLIVYRHMLNRWWPAMFAMGIGMFALAYSEYIQPLGPFLPWPPTCRSSLPPYCSWPPRSWGFAQARLTTAHTRFAPRPNGTPVKRLKRTDGWIETPSANDFRRTPPASRRARRTRMLLALDQRQLLQVHAGQPNDVEHREHRAAPAEQQRVEQRAPSASRHTISPSRIASFIRSSLARPARSESKLRYVCPLRDTSRHVPPSTYASARKPSSFSFHSHAGSLKGSGTGPAAEGGRRGGASADSVPPPVTTTVSVGQRIGMIIMRSPGTVRFVGLVGRVLLA